MTAFPPEYYAELENFLRALMPSVRGAVPPEAWHWYEEYLHAGEYGLAVETVLEHLLNGGDPLPTVAGALVEVADRMGLSSAPVTQAKQRLAERP